MIEPSPFTYVCGYKNRFQSMIQYLVEEGCQVLVITTGRGVTLPFTDSSAFRSPPPTYYSATVVSAFSIGCPWYWPMPLSFALSPKIYNKIKQFKPDIIHCSSPGIMAVTAGIYSKMLRVPLVLSYHTHIPKYVTDYGIGWLVGVAWWLVRWLHRAAHVTLCTSAMLQEELRGKAVGGGKDEEKERIVVWRKGVDTDVFNPSFKRKSVRERLCGGKPDEFVMVYVGRLGAEKNLTFLKDILLSIPGSHLALVGDGPARGGLEQHFEGTQTVFMGMLHGEELSAAYASADVFVMPSESETLGFVVIEAMSSGLPVVAVKAGGIPDIITQQGTTGFLYEPGDLDSAISYVRQLKDDEELRKQVSVTAREQVQQWDWRASTLHLLNVQYPMAVAAAIEQYGKKVGGKWGEGGGEGEGEGKASGQFIVA